MSSGLILLADETYEIGTAKGIGKTRGSAKAAERANTRRCGREGGAERGRDVPTGDEKGNDPTPSGTEVARRRCRKEEAIEEREEPEGEKKEADEEVERHDTSKMKPGLYWWEGGRRVEEWLMKSDPLDTESHAHYSKERKNEEVCSAPQNELEGALEAIDGRERAASGRMAARVETGDFNGCPRNATEGKEATVSGGSVGEGIERKTDDGVRWETRGRGSGGGRAGRQWSRGKINGGLMVCFGRFAGRSISRGNGLVGSGKPLELRLEMRGVVGGPKVDTVAPSGERRTEKELERAWEKASRGERIEISRMGLTGTMEWLRKEGSERAGAGAAKGKRQPAEGLDCRMPIGIEELKASIDGEAGTPFVESPGKRSVGEGRSSPIPSSRSGNCVPSGAEEGRRSDVSAKSADTRDLFGDLSARRETGRAEPPNGFRSTNAIKVGKSKFRAGSSEINHSKNLEKPEENHNVKKACNTIKVQRRMARKKFEIKPKTAVDILRHRKKTLLALEDVKRIRLRGGDDAKDAASPKADGGDSCASLDSGRVTLETLSSCVRELTGSGFHGDMCDHAGGRRRILEILRLQEEFLVHYGIREGYFCRQKEWKAVKRVLESAVADDVLKGESGDAEKMTESTSGKDASSSNEAVHLQQRLRSLSTELVTLRNRLHVSQPNGGGANAPAQSHHQGGNTAHHPHGAPQHQPHLGGHHGGVAALGNLHLSPDDPKSRLHLSGGGVRSGAGCGPLMGRPAPAMAPATPPGAHPSHLHQGQHCAAPIPGSVPRCAVPSASTVDIDDLIHLPGPLTEDAVIRCLHSRFCASQFYTNVGPILVCVNNRRDDGNPLTLSSTRSIPLDPKLSRVVTDAVRQQSETGYPQAIILSGSSGSGKTYTSMLVLRQLFEVAGGGPETDAFKHLAAAFTVLRSLGSARTASNPESSRIGHFIEVQVTDGSLYRTKIHCYFLDQTRVVRPLDSSEKNYHIFYQMLAGLTDQEREKLGLQEYGIHNLRYLNRGNTTQDESRDAARFLAWKACLGILGIPFLEVVRVLSAVLLLGNIQFVEGSRSRAIEVIEVCGSTSSSSGGNGASSGWKKRRRRKRRRGKRAASRRHTAASEEEGEQEEEEEGEEGEEEGEEGEEGEEEDGKRRRSVPRVRSGEEDGEGEEGEEEEGEEEEEEEDAGGRRRSGRRNGGAGSGEELMASVASLLGVAPDALMQGLTTRTRNVRGQLVRTSSDADMSNATRDSLAKALYCRTVATIVRRANSLKRPLGSTSGTLSSDSNDSVHNQAAEVSSQHASTIGTAGSKSSKSMVALNNAVRHATHGFIGILDMFGFEDPKPSQLEHLCINLCAETMQHFYNTHVFKSSIESCRDEGIQCSVQAEYVDNVPCIDLISSLRTGLLSMLDVECSVRGTPESYVQKVRVQHRHNPRLVAEINIGAGGGRTSQHHINGYQYGQQSQMARQGHLSSVMNASAATSFAIRHFAGMVVYDAANFLETNRDVVPDDLVSVFHRHHCNFGFATHLFGSELKALSTSSPHIISPAMTPPVPSSHQQGGTIIPRGVAFRISPTSHTDLQNGDEPVSTLTQDFHTRLDNLLRTLVHARPHFVRCIRADEESSTYSTNSTQGGNTPEEFAKQAVRRQIRSLQILETVNLMAGGFPHRMRFKAFNNRYRSLAPSHCLRSTGQRPCVTPAGGDGGSGGQQEGAEMCVLILQCFQQALLIAGSGASQQAQQHITRNQSQQLGKGLSLGMLAAGSGLLPMSNVSTAWATGKRHIFLSEGARQQLEAMRWERLRRAAVTIQSTWRGWHFRRRRWPTLRLSLGDVRQRVPPQTGGSSQPPSQPPPPPPPPPQHAQIGGGLTCPSSGKPTAAAGRTGAVGSAGKLTGNASSAAAGVGANQGGSLSRPRPQPISGTPPPLEEGGAGGNGAGAAGGNGAGGGALATGVEKCDHKMIQQTCSLFGLDLERPPPVPPSRSYTVAGNTKLGYPQTRVMKMSFSDESAVGSNSADGANNALHKGETVVVIGASPRRGHLLVEHNTCTLHVPYQYLELKAAVSGTNQPQPAGVNI